MNNLETITETLLGGQLDHGTPGDAVQAGGQQAVVVLIRRGFAGQEMGTAVRGEADEIAAAVLYLASPEAAYVTGTTLHVNGGMAMI